MYEALVIGTMVNKYFCIDAIYPKLWKYYQFHQIDNKGTIVPF